MSLPALVALSEECCPDGRADLLHCHGTAALHPTGETECLDDPACRLFPELHALIVSCAEIGCNCA